MRDGIKFTGKYLIAPLLLLQGHTLGVRHNISAHDLVKIHIQNQGEVIQCFLFVLDVLFLFVLSLSTCIVKQDVEDRKSTRLNSSHVAISYAVFCLKKKKQTTNDVITHANKHYSYIHLSL